MSSHGRSGPHVAPELDALALQWRVEAELLRAHGALEAAATKERDATELDAAWRAWCTREPTLRAAAEDSGPCEERLRELARAGKVPLAREEGGDRRRRRSNVPRGRQ